LKGKVADGTHLFWAQEDRRASKSSGRTKFTYRKSRSSSRVRPLADRKELKRKRV